MSVNWVIIGSGKGLSPIRQAITWTNAELLSNGLMGTKFSEIWIGILQNAFEMSSAKMAAILFMGERH